MFHREMLNKTKVLFTKKKDFLSNNEIIRKFEINIKIVIK